MGVIDEVKGRLDIVDVIGQVVPLQRAGRSFKAPCPFHSERTPSFIVSPERQTWHCFGACATGGDVISFVMKRENLEFGEALRQLAQRAGVDLHEQRRPEEDERQRRLLEANEAAAAFFHNALLNSDAGAEARDYLATRGLDSDTIEAFQLGYSLESWDALRSHLARRGFAEPELLAAGLLVESDRGGYDRFRGRLMFPIRDDRGRIAGFGGRALSENETGAKYINTPQTPMFDKGRLLYALDRAKESVRREQAAIVVEGYMDAIAAHQHGRTNVVASMGTALTERQIRLLERLRCKVYLALDADAAGVEATLRALQEAGATGAIRATPDNAADLSDEEFDAKVREWSRDALKRAAVNFFVVPLSGKDPDEMIRADPAAWESAVAGAKPFTEHVFEVVASRRDLSQPAERAELLKELLPVVRLIDEPIHQGHYVQRLARLARVREDVVRAELRKRPSGARQQQPAATASGGAPRYSDPNEEFLLALLLQNPALRPEGLGLEPDFLHLIENGSIFALWRQTADVEVMRETLPEELHGHLDRISQRRIPTFDGAQANVAFQDCVLKIRSTRLAEAKRAITEMFYDVGDLTQDTATAFSEDKDLGLELHQLTLQRNRVRHPEASPQGEGEP